MLADNKCEGCDELSDDLKADAGDNILCAQCRNNPVQILTIQE